jgi:hypothetical protein
MLGCEWISLRDGVRIDLDGECSAATHGQIMPLPPRSFSLLASHRTGDTRILIAMHSLLNLARLARTALWAPAHPLPLSGGQSQWRISIALTFLLLLIGPHMRALSSQTRDLGSYDVVVYRATAAGAVAAIAAAESGARVVIVESGRNVGGMVSGGLGRTDMDRQQHLIGGFAGEFYRRVGRHYDQPLAWFFEPHVAERVFRDWLQEAGVPVHFEQRLVSVEKEGARIVRLVTDTGASYGAAVFIDASYEGDLLKEAGISYAVGRESRSKYGENYAGRHDFLPGGHQLRVPTPARDSDGNLLPYVTPEEELVPTGEGDGKIQAFCFRLCLTSNPTNRIEIGPPEGYDPARFGLVRSYVRALGGSARLGDFTGIASMPNQKTDLNAGGGVSVNLPGAGLEYIEATPERRREIWEEHRSWAHGLLYFLGNDPSVPESLRVEARQWGLPRDEFAETGHWPHQMYVREARRMYGEHVLTERDLLGDTAKYDSIGMGQYNIDIREVQWVGRTVYRFPNVRQEVLMEGYVSVPVEPYEIPYRSLLPRYHECSNLLVPVAISASHVAFASFRMEPQFMIAGHASGVAAALSLRLNVPVHHVPVAELQALLRAQGQILRY